jgi:NAD(P)-dependent dehydrogenase (short-subunit alcohol dehydrogenase family)
VSAAARRPRWTAADILDQSGRTAVVTGANSGIGFEIARALAGRGARVLLACRNDDKAEAAAQRIRADNGSALVELVQLDLSDLASVRDAAKEIGRRCVTVDLLVNNAGVLWPPFTLTDQKIELQFATNHLGHFALTGLLLDRIIHSPGARVVNLASLGHWLVRDFDLTDLSFSRGYRPFEDYGQSKLAILLFTRELQRRLAHAGAPAIAVAAHPGGAKTELIRHEPLKITKMFGVEGLRRMTQFQSALSGALSPLRAATDPSVRGGEYYGPGGPLELVGAPKPARSSRRSRDPQLAREVWTVSEELTGVHYDV